MFLNKKPFNFDDFPNICRTCIYGDNLKPIEENLIVIEAFENIFDVKYKLNDDLPQKICEKCVNKINEIQSFVLQVKEIDVDLKNCLISTNKPQDPLDVAAVVVKEEVISDEELTEKKVEIQCIKVENEKKKRPLKRTCNICNKTFTQASGLKKHMRIHTAQRSYQCSLCSKAFTDPSNFRRHVRVTHSKDQPYECKVCGKRFKASKNLQVHELQHNGVRPYKCDECGKDFTQLCHLNQHRWTHRKNRKQYWCYVCRKTFVLPTELTKHLRAHPDLKPFKCDVCGKDFNQRCNMLKHKLVHTRVKPYLCKVCGKTFAQYSSLLRHEFVHSGERPYQCDLCDKAFFVASYLRQHKATHTGEKPFQCDVCARRFTRASTLKRHAALHMFDDDESNG